MDPAVLFSNFRPIAQHGIPAGMFVEVEAKFVTRRFQGTQVERRLLSNSGTQPGVIRHSVPPKSYRAAKRNRKAR